MSSLIIRKLTPFELQPDRATAFDQAIAGAMSRELHKTAQPLTILQGLIEFMRARVAAGDECNKFVERGRDKGLRLAGCDECRCFLKRAGEEVPRLVSSFDDVRKLAGLQRPARDVTSFPLLPMMTEVLQILRADLDIAGITVVCDPRFAEDPMSVMANASPSRVSTAIRLVVTTLVDFLLAGDRITVSMESDGPNAALRFRSSRHSQLAIAEQERVRKILTSQLEFAQLLVATVGGELQLNDTPDIVVLSLPGVAPQSSVQHQPERALHV